MVTGSVARGEAYPGNDLDILLIANDTIHHKEYRVGESLVEIGGGPLESALARMESEPMKLYMYLDAQAVFDKGNNLEKLKEKAQQILDSYQPAEEDKKALIKWLSSVADKVKVARKNADTKKVGFHISNVLWKVVEGLYMVNSLPTPAATSALRRATTLKRLPENFDELWNKTLLGNLEERVDSTLKLIEFILGRIQ